MIKKSNKNVHVLFIKISNNEKISFMDYSRIDLGNRLC